MSEFRKHGRFVVSNSMTLSHDRIGQLKTYTRDMSQTGMFVDCQRLAGLLEPGDRLNATVETNSQVFDTVVRVVRISHDGVGFTYD